MFFCDFRYFLAEIEGPEQKSDSEVKEDFEREMVEEANADEGGEGSGERGKGRDCRMKEEDILKGKTWS